MNFCLNGLSFSSPPLLVPGDDDDQRECSSTRPHHRLQGHSLRILETQPASWRRLRPRSATRLPEAQRPQDDRTSQEARLSATDFQRYSIQVIGEIPWK